MLSELFGFERKEFSVDFHQHALIVDENVEQVKLVTLRKILIADAVFLELCELEHRLFNFDFWLFRFGFEQVCLDALLDNLLAHSVDTIFEQCLEFVRCRVRRNLRRQETLVHLTYVLKFLV